MTLRHFRTNFPVVYKKYLNSNDALQGNRPALNRIRDFLYHQGIEISLVPDENQAYYFPMIKFSDNTPGMGFEAYRFKSQNKALSYGVESAIAYLETGFYN